MANAEPPTRRPRTRPRPRPVPTTHDGEIAGTECLNGNVCRYMHVSTPSLYTYEHALAPSRNMAKSLEAEREEWGRLLLRHLSTIDSPDNALIMPTVRLRATSTL